jgi:hypothetical protein
VESRLEEVIEYLLEIVVSYHEGEDFIDLEEVLVVLPKYLKVVLYDRFLI